MSKYYKRAIDIISMPVDHRNIVMELAKHHPKILCDIFYSLGWENEVKHALKDGASKIEAVKLCRHLTGMGLKESKEAVEKVQERL